MIRLTDIAPAFAFLEEAGFTSSVSTYQPEAFGNASLEMTGAPFSVRFERDRGEVWVEVGDADRGWHKLEDVLRFLDPALDSADIGEPPQAALLAPLLQAKWGAAVELFGMGERLTRLSEYEQRRAAAMLQRLFKPK